MKSATFATMTALAALLVATPGIVTPQAEAKMKAANIKPRIKVVRPKVRIRLNTKQLTAKTQNGPTSQNTAARTTNKTVKPTTAFTNSALLQQRSASDRFAFENQSPNFSAAIKELEGVIGVDDLGGTDISGLADLDVAALDPLLGIPGLGTSDETGNSPIPPGFESRLVDPSTVGGVDSGIFGFISNTHKGDTPDTGHVAVTPGSIGSAVGGVAGDKDNEGSASRRTPYGNFRGSQEGHRTDHRGEDKGYRVFWTDPDGTQHMELRVVSSDGGDHTRHTETTPATVTTRDGNTYTTTVQEPGSTETTGETGGDEDNAQVVRTGSHIESDAGDTQTEDTSTTELRNPDAPGGEYIPVYCGSHECNEARKGHRLGPNEVTAGGTRALPADPAGNQGGIVADAPRTNDNWRRVATTNPGSEHHDTGDNRRTKTNNDQILIINGPDLGPAVPTTN